MRLLLVPFLVLVACALGCSSASATPSPTHERLTTPRGPVHVWTPAGYDREAAGIVVYVHGFYTTVDRAWREHGLPEQFAESGVNAMFIACSAPASARDTVSWPRLDDLLATVAREMNGLPRGRVVIVGHSGAHRTLSKWLTDDRVGTVMILDGVYGDKVDDYKAWIDGAPNRRMVTTATPTATAEHAERLHALLPDTLVIDGFPPPSAGHLPGAREARVVYVRSQHGHMSLVTNGVALPMLLRATTLSFTRPDARTAPIATR